MIPPLPAIVRDSVRVIPKPASADSLAGVLARLFPQLVDSADVDRITWRQSPKQNLGMASAVDYAYRNGMPKDRSAVVPMVAQAIRTQGKPVVTFAARKLPNSTSWADDADLVKHEMFHAMSKVAQDHVHTPERSGLFALLERYHGR